MSSANSWMPGSNGPSSVNVVVRRGQAGADRPPDGARRAGPVGLGPLSHAARQHGQDGGQERAEASRLRVGAALDRPVRVQQPRGVECARMVVRDAGEPGERVAGDLAVGVQQDGDVLVDVLQRHVVGRPEAWVVAPLDHLGAPVAGQRGPAVVAAGVHDDQPRRVERPEQCGELVPRLVEHDDDRVAHRSTAAIAAARRAVDASTSNAASARRRAAAGASGSASTARRAAAAASASPGG